MGEHITSAAAPPGVLAIERDGDVKTLSLSRPEKLNALDAALVEALLAEVNASHADGTRLLVFRGAGRGFSAGFDFSGLETMSDGDLALRFLRLEHLLQAIYYAPFATLALAHGTAFGAAADIVASCSRRVAAPGTKFRMPGLRFGVVLGTRRLSRVIGRDRSRSLLMTSKVFAAEEALHVDFVDTLLPEERWSECVAAIAGEVRTLPAASAATLLRLTADDTRDQDLAELARSVSEPGLKQRIATYLASLKR